MPDGTIIQNVPDGTTQADLLQRYQAYHGKPPQDAERGIFNRAAFPTMLGLTPDVIMGGRQVIDAGAQMLTRGLESAANAIAPDSAFAKTMTGERKNVEAINQQALDAYKRNFSPDTTPGADFARGVGQMLLTAPLTAAAPATTLPRIIAQGAGIGAASNALTPVYGDAENFGRQKIGQAAGGALAGGLTAGAFGVAGRAIAPNVSQDVRAMLDANVTPTPGQMLGGAFKTAEEKASSLPIVGDAIRSAQRKGLEEYNVALYNRILAPIGEKYTGPAGQEGLAAVGDKLSAAYEDALARSVPNIVTPAFRQRLDSLTAMVPAAKRPDFADAIQREIYAKVTPGGTLTPSVAKDAESNLGQLVRDYAGSQGDDRILSRAYQQAQSELRKLVAENNPRIAPRLQAIDQGWTNLVQLENAANSTKVARNAGLVTPADQLRGIKKSDYSARDRRFARGEMPNQDFAQAADAVLSNKYPDSGTTGRMLMNSGVLGALGGGAAFEPTVGMPMTIAGLLASAPYLPGGRQAMAALFGPRPASATAAGDLLKGLAPYLGGAVGGLLTLRQ